MDKIAVLIPCYNEAKTIEKVVKDFCKTLGKDAKIYVYDNNSSDKTAEIAKKAGAIVKHEYAQGKGNVVRRMFREIDAEVYIMVDGDDTYPAESAKAMVDLVLKKNAAMVVGDRLSSTYFNENKRPFHNLGNSMVRFLVNRLFKTNIKDIMTGYRAFSYEFVKTYPVLSKNFEIETEMSIHAAHRNLQVENLIIEYRDRPEGSESKLNTYLDGAKVLRTIARLCSNYRPLMFYSLISLVLFIIGLCFFIPVLVNFFHTGLVAQFPTLIVSCFIMFIALLFLVAGIIMNYLVSQDAKNFEMHLVRVNNDKKHA